MLGTVGVAVLLLQVPIHLFPQHDISFASLPIFTLALLTGPLPAAVAAALTAAVALSLGSLDSLLAVLLLVAPALGYAQARYLHPGFACLIAPLGVALVNNLLAPVGTDRLHLLAVDVLQGAVNVIFAFGLGLMASTALRSPSTL